MLIEIRCASRASLMRRKIDKFELLLSAHDDDRWLYTENHQTRSITHFIQKRTYSGIDLARTDTVRSARVLVANPKIRTLKVVFDGKNSATRSVRLASTRS